ncbi:MAG: CRISPR-associated endonuclease Cas2 [Rhodospirillales bacterium]|nr:CRISPR-associated endonuclease Cas2 [Alphaproteobacteria bacterium]MCB9976896.1 CRISPR-associated endonuclease Cas2 [Rhodospirillales bacterium]
MSAAKDRFMWLFVFFDLPVKTKTERRVATRFRNFLLKDGYMMIQFSVYARICKGQDRVDKHLQRLTGAIPQKGSVRVMQVTDKQYERMKILVGTKKNNEKTKAEQLVLF